VTGQIKEEGCIFCNRMQCDAAQEFVLFRGDLWYMILNHYPYTNGHLLLVLNRHQPALSACSAAEMAEMARLLPLMEQALLEVYRPQGINCGYNGGASAGAGIPEHLHLHMLPRWQGDTSFMTTVGDTRVMPETLEQTFQRLRPVMTRILAQDPD